jgi:hypothetical protein
MSIEARIIFSELCCYRRFVGLKFPRVGWRDSCTGNVSASVARLLTCLRLISVCYGYFALATAWLPIAPRFNLAIDFHGTLPVSATIGIVAQAPTTPTPLHRVRVRGDYINPPSHLPSVSTLHRTISHNTRSPKCPPSSSYRGTSPKLNRTEGSGSVADDPAEALTRSSQSAAA